MQSHQLPGCTHCVSFGAAMASPALQAARQGWESVVGAHLGTLSGIAPCSGSDVLQALACLPGVHSKLLPLFDCCGDCKNGFLFDFLQHSSLERMRQIAAVHGVKRYKLKGAVMKMMQALLNLSRAAFQLVDKEVCLALH
jgi:hypothetical protein